MGKILLTTFTDPMMGLSYECEPVYEALKTRFTGKIQFRYVMSGLVRDIGDFMLAEEREMPEEEGIRAYNRRLAAIYKSEEPIGGLPMNMENFHLFDAEHRSSYPLNIAYKAAELCDIEKAEVYLSRLRRATIVEGRQTTRKKELIAVAEETGLDTDLFCQHLEDGSAEQAFLEDLRLTCSLGIHSLPACRIQCDDNSVIVSGLLGFAGFVEVIEGMLGR